MTQPEQEPGITIRRMEIDDLAQVTELDRISFSLPWPVSSFKFELESNQVSRCWVVETQVAEQRPVLVGMIVVWLIVDELHIATLAVHPHFRKQGIARHLLVHTLIDAFHSGATRSFLEVRSGNIAARTLYANFGFQEVGIRPHYYQDNGEDAVMMNLEEFDLAKLESLR